jgi:hypothetical protein
MEKNFIVIYFAFIALVPFSKSSAQWKKLASFADTSVSSFACNKTKIFAATKSGSIYSSIDSGNSWSFSLAEIFSGGKELLHLVRIPLLPVA